MFFITLVIDNCLKEKCHPTKYLVSRARETPIICLVLVLVLVLVVVLVLCVSINLVDEFSFYSHFPTRDLEK